jgi:UDP-N-acetylglucosamine transferase subunit ALG13
VDHIVLRAVHPEFDNVIANHQLMPIRMSESKNTFMSDHQKDLAKKLQKAGLLGKR